MTLAWREHEEALAEYRAAVEWYEDKRAGLGDVFIAPLTPRLRASSTPQSVGDFTWIV